MAATQDSARAASRQINAKGLGLRAFAARGVLVNTAFDIAVSSVSLLRGLILAAILTRSDYGVWGILTASLGVLASIKIVGVGEKYIQQDEEDQELAFQKAFTLEMMMSTATAVVLVASLPLVALIYGQWQILAPGLAIILMLFGGALQTPYWVFYREMDFVRQRTIQAIEPLVGFVVMIGLALAGLGYWAFVIGALAGSFSAALYAIAHARYPMRFRYDRGTLRIYRAYSAPILVAVVCNIVLAFAGSIAVNAHLGLAAVGVVSLAMSVTSWSTRVDDLVATTLFPAVCAVQDRLDLLRESFVKSNRLALMWAMPFGCGLALFAHDLVHFLLGDKWLPGVILLQINGLAVAIGHIAFNWDDYLRARGNTRPIAVTAVFIVLTFLAVGVPLVFVLGLKGLGIGIFCQVLVGLACRAYYMTRTFDGFRFLPHAMRAMLPTIPAVAAVLLVRLLVPGPQTWLQALVELVLYALVTAAATLLLERRLIREVIGYVRGSRVAPPVQDAIVGPPIVDPLTGPLG